MIDNPDETLYPVHKTHEEYAKNTVRKIEVILDAKEYGEIIGLLKVIRQKEHLTTNTEAICFVLRAYAHS